MKIFHLMKALLIHAGGTASIVNIVNPDVDAYSGDILYINTLASAVERSAEQTEDIRIVIQLG